MHEYPIYIIDDHEAIRHALHFLFDSIYGIQVKTYHEPLLFLGDLSPQWHGCLIIDLFMPGMNGIDLMKKIKEFNPFIKIIIMSGNGSTELARQAVAAGAEDFITKPFRIEELLTKIKIALPNLLPEFM